MKIYTRLKGLLWSVLLSVSILLLMGTVWIRRAYGILPLAMVDESFRSGLSNKRSLFVKYVILPAFIVLLVSLLIDRILTKSVRRLMTYIMGVLMVSAVCISAIGLDVGSYLGRQYRMSQEQWYDVDNLVMHALGRIDDIRYTNCKEALENSYQNGNKVFECDMIMTADEELVACHDWVFWNEKANTEDLNTEGKNGIYVPTLDVFMNHKFLDKYTPLSGKDLVLFLKDHPDAYMITDTKSHEPEEIKAEFQELVNVAEENGCKDVLDRFVVQLYRGYMHGIVEEIYPFPNYIFTLYDDEFRGETVRMEEYAKFCLLYNVDVITMDAQYYHDELLDICNRYGIRLFVHTVNDREEIATYHEKGIGVYTDNPERQIL